MLNRFNDGDTILFTDDKKYLIIATLNDYVCMVECENNMNVKICKYVDNTLVIVEDENEYREASLKLLNKLIGNE